MSVENVIMQPDEGCFLEYQINWLLDTALIKLWEKSRRIGATYIQAYEDVHDALTLKIRNKPCDVWFSSADLSAAKEYIGYCCFFSKMYNTAAKYLGEIVIDEEKDIKAYCLQFKNGARIHALSSNPTQFRSKGGKVVIDEFAHHKDQEALWQAAYATAVIWGYPLRILSSHNGVLSKFNNFIKKIKEGKLKWSHHRTTIVDAVNMGLADKIQGRKLSLQERQEWLDFVKENAGDELTWLQEFMCDPVDEGSSFLSYAAISSCHSDCLMPVENIKGELYVGMDIAREKHLSVISVLEKLGDVRYLRRIDVLKGVRFKIQKAILWSILEHMGVRRACIDSTGIGKQMSEEAQEAFGKFKVEQVDFTNSSKAELAYLLYTAFEDKNIRIPDIHELNADLHSVKKFVTKAGNIRLDSDAAETDGHGDRFWSIALAYSASVNSPHTSGEVMSAKKRKNISDNTDFDFGVSESFLRRLMF